MRLGVADKHSPDVKAAREPDMRAGISPARRGTRGPLPRAVRHGAAMAHRTAFRPTLRPDRLPRGSAGS